MKYKRIFMPYDTNFVTMLMMVRPSDYEDTNKAENEITKLLSEGWRIISTAPITGSQAYDRDGLSSLRNRPEMVYTFTTGIVFFLVKE
jgi:hypothetical protein